MSGEGENDIRLSVRLPPGLTECLDRWAAEKCAKGRKSDRSDQIRVSITMRMIDEFKRKKET